MRITAPTNCICCLVESLYEHRARELRLNKGILLQERERESQSRLESHKQVRLSQLSNNAFDSGLKQDLQEAEASISLSFVPIRYFHLSKSNSMAHQGSSCVNRSSPSLPKMCTVSSSIHSHDCIAWFSLDSSRYERTRFSEQVTIAEPTLLDRRDCATAIRDCNEVMTLPGA